MTRQKDVGATTPLPTNPRVKNEGIEHLIIRLETLCVQKLEHMITDTDRHFHFLENQWSRCSSAPATPVIQNIINLGKYIQVLMDATKNLPFDVEAIKRNILSLSYKIIINSSSNLISK